jgi:hypothetical protein
MEMTWRLAPGRQPGHIDASGAVRYQVARTGNQPAVLPRTGLGGCAAASSSCLAGTVAIIGWGAVDA